MRGLASSARQAIRAGMYSLRNDGSFGRPASQTDANLLSAAKCVFFGEIHSALPCIELQTRTAAAMLGSTASGGRLHVLLEHFNFEMQPLLDDYAAGRLSLEQLAEGSGSEGHDILSYAPLLEFCSHGEQRERVQLHAGFIPRSFARMVMRESAEEAVAAAAREGYVSAGETLAGTDAHYSFFESLLTGRNLHNRALPPTDTYRKMFPAQVIKDAAMAHKLNTLVDASIDDADKFLCICGIGHSGYSHGVPERVFATHPQLEARSYRIWSLPLESRAPLAEGDEAMQRVLVDHFGAPGTSNPADLCLAFSMDDGTATGVESSGEFSGASSQTVEADAAKAATADAYNAVGATAALHGNLARARAIMSRLGYSAHEIEIAGDDAYNFQGVGCPHRLAALRPGEHVLDLGSGLGIDSFIALDAVHDGGGSVRGVDLAEKEVRHATARAVALRLSRVEFVSGDIERLGDVCEPATIDVVISNGAFCLVPDKPKAFRAMFTALKPGGRFAICTSTLRTQLEPGVNWPLCMRMFIEQAALAPTCEAAGFTDVVVDASDSEMQFELPELATADASGAGESPQPPATGTATGGDGRANQGVGRAERNQVHVGSAEFSHLAGYDMNALCARVVVTGRKPA